MEEKLPQEEGVLYGVSVGPGDPELMTLKAARVIRQAQVLALPHEKKENCVAYQIACQAVPEAEGKEILLIPMPMTKDPEILEKSHSEGARRIFAELQKGKTVALLTLGDVSVYSTCWYLYRRVKEMGGRGSLVSGVPSFCAAAARLDISLASGSQELHILPASYQIEEGLSLPGVKVLMKTGSRLKAVKKLLEENSLPVQGVRRCGMEGEELYRSAGEIREDAGYYSLFIVGEKLILSEERERKEE